MGGLKLTAPAAFAEWLAHNRVRSKVDGRTYNYHPRSDAHSKALAEFIWNDLVETCEAVRADFNAGLIQREINYKHTWPRSGHSKTIDLAVITVPAAADQTARVLISCELKTVATEHKKSEPRLYDELNGSHAIVHEGDPAAIAAGVTAVNISESYISPTRQSEGTEQKISVHTQPRVTESMVNHLRGLPVRHEHEENGFDAYSTFVVSFDNKGHSELWEPLPAPQPGDEDHYGTFLRRLCEAYTTLRRALTLP